MPLETATYINGLVSTNPAGTDQVSQADDHLRLIKSTLTNTFPNITGQVTATHTQINAVALGAGAPQVLSATVDNSPQLTLQVSGVTKGTLTSATALSLKATNALGATTFSVDQSVVPNAQFYGPVWSINGTNTNQGYYQFGTSGTKYLSYDGTNFNFSGGPVLAGSATQAFIAQTSSDNPYQVSFWSNSVLRSYIGANSTYALLLSNAAGAGLLSVDATGNMVATANVSAYSDRRLKTDIEPISDALDLLDEVHGVYYTRLDSGARRVGVIAQDVQKSIPEAVLEDVGTGLLSVSYGDLVGVLVQAIKELECRIFDLEEKLDEKGA